MANWRFPTSLAPRRYQRSSRGKLGAKPAARTRASTASTSPTSIWKFAPRPNARRHSTKQVRQISESIKAFGSNVPFLVDREGDVIAGHGRLLAARRVGWSDVPIVRLKHLRDAKRRAFMIADNRRAEVATWDDRLLAEQLRELASVNLDFELKTIGFDTGP